MARPAPPLSEVFERYALGLARGESLPAEEDPQESASRRRALWEELSRLGLRGWPRRRTVYTGRLPSGCVPCLKGRGSNLCLTTLCNRDCFFCFNPKPRVDSISVHGRGVPGERDIPAALDGLGLRSVGLSGGEPLLDPGLVLRTILRLRGRFGRRLRIDLYTNGDLLTRPILRQLRGAGLDGIRLNLAASGYEASPVRLALDVFKEVEVEIPAIPGHEARLARLADALDSLGARNLILHELFCSAQNLDGLKRLGLRSCGARSERLTWGPVAGSEEAALRTLMHVLKRRLRLGAYYCSCATQDWIAERALALRGLAPAEPAGEGVRGEHAAP